MARCERHAFEKAVAICDGCYAEFCGDCIVRPAGNKKPPMCMSCALVAAGIRRKTRAEIAEAKRRRKHLGDDLVEPAPAVGRSMVGLLVAAGVTAALAVPILSHVA